MRLVQGYFELAVEALEPALARCRSAEFPIYVSRIASFLAAALASIGRIDDALPLINEAIQHSAVTNLRFSNSLVLSNCGRVCHLAGQHSEALAHARDAIDVARACGERGNEGWAECLLRELVSNGADSLAGIQDARGYYGAALTIAEGLGMLPLQAQCLYGLSRLHNTTGKGSFAEQLAAQATALCPETGMKLLLG
ncbi:hypothetical protein AWB77_01807 [Caballeronia fortuita]|uniref:Tetratricopeptide repeat protein n=1 Tax=Caballeronia fortuita TaxID=1777138 RepID=A0A158AHL5_9BURK|nr:tetratricopeptide repeat protein [Caballeronia fortuita]SAK57260.1 hypothetical protein AWB77_01807 [Caballeronia fortuita]